MVVQTSDLETEIVSSNELTSPQNGCATLGAKEHPLQAIVLMSEHNSCFSTFVFMERSPVIPPLTA